LFSFINISYNFILNYKIELEEMDNESPDGSDGGGEFFGSKENYSPFKPPNEEQVFITREAEK